MRKIAVVSIFVSLMIWSTVAMAMPAGYTLLENSPDGIKVYGKGFVPGISIYGMSRDEGSDVFHIVLAVRAGERHPDLKGRVFDVHAKFYRGDIEVDTLYGGTFGVEKKEFVLPCFNKPYDQIYLELK
jgi:hypothetical protein